MAEFVEAVGLIGSVIGIVSFVKDLIPNAPAPRGAAVNIKAGLDTVNATNLGGDISSVYGFNGLNGYLGKSGSVHVKSGDIQEVIINQKSGGVRSDFVSVANANDATCIAWVTVKMDDKTAGGVWLGDVGYQCGQPWMYSEVEAGQMLVFNETTQQNDTVTYKPRCTWLDADHTNAIPIASMKFRVGAYGEDLDKFVNNTEEFCKYSTFDIDNGPIKRAPGGTDTPQSVQRRTNGVFPTFQNSSSVSHPPSNITRPNLLTFNGNLITSNYQFHTSKDLCESKTSHGPDFIGSDGLFCDMTTRKLSPLCSTQKVEGCIEVNFKQKTVVKRTIIARREVDVVHKSYKQIATWD